MTATAMGCGDFEGKRAKGLDSLLRYILYTRKAVPVLLENLSKTFFFSFCIFPSSFNAWELILQHI